MSYLSDISAKNTILKLLHLTISLLYSKDNSIRVVFARETICCCRWIAAAKVTMIITMNKPLKMVIHLIDVDYSAFAH